MFFVVAELGLTWDNEDHQMIALLCFQQVQRVVEITKAKMAVTALVEEDILTKDGDTDKLNSLSAQMKELSPPPAV
jgi:hypothetical protein